MAKHTFLTNIFIHIIYVEHQSNHGSIFKSQPVQHHHGGIFAIWYIWTEPFGLYTERLRSRDEGFMTFLLINVPVTEVNHHASRRSGVMPNGPKRDLRLLRRGGNMVRSCLVERGKCDSYSLKTFDRVIVETMFRVREIHNQNVSRIVSMAYTVRDMIQIE